MVGRRNKSASCSSNFTNSIWCGYLNPTQKQPTPLSDYFMQPRIFSAVYTLALMADSFCHIWGINFCKGCVILMDAIPVDKGFKTCYKFDLITNTPTTLLL